MPAPGAPRPASTAPGGRCRLACAAAITAAVGAAALTGCSGPAQVTAGPAGPAATPTATAQAVSTPTAPATSAAATPGSPASPAVPVLGRLAGVFAQGTGFGQARPAKIFNGGDPTGLVTHITWTSWGGPQANGSGTAEYVGAGQSVATGTQETATIVAFRLGTCHGVLMYRALEWYFPQQGQSFTPGQYEDVCAGRYVPGV